MRRIVEKMVSEREATVYGYVRGNARNFERTLMSYMSGKNIIRLKKDQSGAFHVPRTTMFKLFGRRDVIDSAISHATQESGAFKTVKEYMGWVPGYLNDVTGDR